MITFNDEIQGSLKKVYKNYNLEFSNSDDIKYLEEAFNSIYDLWKSNFDNIKEVKYLMLAEAPLWGKNKTYIYNPDANHTSFFYRGALSKILPKENITNQKEFIDVCNRIGLLVVDISPFPLNTTNTKINYSKNDNNSIKIKPGEYFELIRSTMPYFFCKKIEMISNKSSDEIQIFFRYKRVKESFSDVVEETLKTFKLNITEIDDIGQRGGGMDTEKLRNILLRNNPK